MKSKVLSFGVADRPACISRLRELFRSHPPSTIYEEKRKNAFLEIDSMILTPRSTDEGGLFDIGGPGRNLPDNPLKLLYEDMVRDAVKTVRHTVVKEGVLLVQLYNMGYLVKTPTCTFGFDVTRGPMHHNWKWEVSPKIVESLADSMDFMCITHARDAFHGHAPSIWLHTDHFDHGLTKRMLDRGKKVLVPDGLREHLGDNRFTYCEDSLSLDLGGIHITPYCGTHCYQDNPYETPLMLFEAITSDGIKLFFTGDHDYTRLDSFPFKDDIDILILHIGGISPFFEGRNPNDLGDDVDALMQGLGIFSSKVVVAGHLAELTHPIGGGREGYFIAWAAFDRLLTERFPARFLIMFWGEHFHYGRNGKNKVVASVAKTEKIADLPPNEMIDIPTTTVTGPGHGDTTDTTTTKTTATIPSVSSKIAGRKSGRLNFFHKIVNNQPKK